MDTRRDERSSRRLSAAHREREVLAAALFLALTLGAFLGWCLLVIVIAPVTAVPDSLARLPDFATGLSLMLVGLPAAALGFLLVVRGEGKSAGWLLMAGGAGSVVPLFTGLLVAVVPAPEPLLLGALLVQWLGSAAYAYVLLAIPLHFPGRSLPPSSPLTPSSRFSSLSSFPSLSRWTVRVYAYALLAVCLLIGAVAAGAQEAVQGRVNPLRATAWGEWARAWLEPCMRSAPWLLVVCGAVSVLAVAARRPPRPHRHSRTAGYAAAYVVWMWAEFADEIGWMAPWASTVTFAVLTGAWLGTIGYAASHDGIWRLDRNVRRLLVTAVVVGGVTGALVVASFAVSTVLPGAATPGGLALAALALGIGGGMRPLAGWAARRVDRVFHGVRARPYEAVRTLADRLHLAPDPGGVPEALCRSATDCLRFPGAAVDVETRAGLRRLTATGSGPGAAPHVLPLRHRGTVIGAVLVAPRPGEEELHPLDADLLRLLADQAAPALEVLRLLEDVTAARRELVLAREEERRRLRRDMHDGLGPLLAAALLQLDIAQGASDHPEGRLDHEQARSGAARAQLAAAPAPPGAAPPAPRLADAGGDGGASPLSHARYALEEAVGEVRRLTSGLGPAALVDQGLGPALHELADRLGRGARGPRFAVGLTPEPLPPLPAAVETALHRLAAEALSNAARHAGATEVELTLSVSPRQALLTVTDNGRGLPSTVRPGALGLTTMAERARELGGSCTVGPPPVGGGTRVRAAVPLAGPPPAAAPSSVLPAPALPCPVPPGPRSGQRQDAGPGRPGHRAPDAGAT
ncbi:sensor histidine kinase [Streptomyces arboris]|uniref:sensor histidine kinase n=1 Tax=Streptomyces arboris TaxID=2600619 RepID=UPI003C2D90B1